MSILTASGLAMHYGAQDVFAEVSLAVAHGDRIALVGANGVGKTTLLRILAGLEVPSQGEVHMARGLRLGYLPQRPTFTGEARLYDEMLAVFADLRAQEDALRRLEAAMADPARHEEALARYGELQARFELAGGYEYENRIRHTLASLGFSEADFDQPLALLSGGQRTRALLAKLILSRPDLLLLDEPTNHLDVAAIEWLEETLVAWPGSVITVAHDRRFLDVVANRVWELSFGRLEAYPGNYSRYVELRVERRARQREEYEAQQAEIARQEEFIRRYMAGQRSKEAKGRLKRLERVERLERPQEERTLRLSIPAGERAGETVIHTRGLVVGYDDDAPGGERTWPDANGGSAAPPGRTWPDASGGSAAPPGRTWPDANGGSAAPPGRTWPDASGGSTAPRVRRLFSSPNLRLYRGERAALLGPNGSGKTTFLRTLLGQIPPLEGEVRLGYNVHVGYFAQAQEGLDPARTVLDELLATKDLTPGEARGFLARFLFFGDDVFKTIESLSGGERARVALAKLTLEGANLLLLDEPTNHLDIPSQEALQAVLERYGGTILFVTHDRWLVDALATQVWVLEGDRLQVYPGGYAEYLAACEQAAAAAKAAQPAVAARAQRAPKEQAARARARASKAATALEEEIAALEERLRALQEEISQASLEQNLEQVRTLGEDYAALSAELEQRLEEWSGQVSALS